MSMFGEIAVEMFSKNIKDKIDLEIKTIEEKLINSNNESYYKAYIEGLFLAKQIIDKTHY